jgi:hypothetical protein
MGKSFSSLLIEFSTYFFPHNFLAMTSFRFLLVKFPLHPAPQCDQENPFFSDTEKLLNEKAQNGISSGASLKGATDTCQFQSKQKSDSERTSERSLTKRFSMMVD